MIEPIGGADRGQRTPIFATPVSPGHLIGTPAKAGRAMAAVPADSMPLACAGRTPPHLYSARTLSIMLH